MYRGAKISDDLAAARSVESARGTAPPHCLSYLAAGRSNRRCNLLLIRRLMKFIAAFVYRLSSPAVSNHPSSLLLHYLSSPPLPSSSTSSFSLSKKPNLTFSLEVVSSRIERIFSSSFLERKKTFLCFMC